MAAVNPASSNLESMGNRGRFETLARSPVAWLFLRASANQSASVTRCFVNQPRTPWNTTDSCVSAASRAWERVISRGRLMLTSGGLLRKG